MTIRVMIDAVLGNMEVGGKTKVLWPDPMVGAYLSNLTHDGLFPLAHLRQLEGRPIELFLD